MKSDTMKKILSLLLAVILISNFSVSTSVMAAGEAQDSTLILHYDFTDGVKDISGNGNDGTIHGNVYTSGGLALLNGGYIQMPSNLVDGLSEISVSAWVYHDNAQNYARVFDFGSTDQFKYYNLLLTNDNIPVNEIRKAENNSMSEVRNNDKKITPGEWVHVVSTLKDGQAKLYINGEKVAEIANPVLAGTADLGATVLNYIGKSRFSKPETITNFNDPNFVGEIEDFKVYKKVLTDDEVTAEFNSKGDAVNITKAKTLRDAVDKIQIDGLADVTGNLNLPLQSQDGAIDFTWKSSNTAIIGDDGTYTAPVQEGAMNVTLTVTAEMDGILCTKDFNAVVKTLGAKVIGSNSIKLIWPAVETATSYNIYRALADNGTYTCITTSGAIDLTTSGAINLSYTDTGLDANITYYYKVAAVIGGVEVTTPYAMSDFATTTIDPGKYYKIVSRKSRLAVSCLDKGTTNATNLVINTDKSDNSDLDQIWRFEKQDSGFYKIINVKSKKIASCLNGDTGNNVPCTIYEDLNAADQFWRIQPGSAGYLQLINNKSGRLMSCSGGGTDVNTHVIQFDFVGGATDQEWSIVDSGIQAPSKVTVNAETKGADSIKLSWDAVAGVTGYNVFMSLTENGNYSKLASVDQNSLSYTNIGLNSDKTYYYKVIAVNGAYESLPSEIASATTSISGQAPSGDTFVNPVYASQDPFVTKGPDGFYYFVAEAPGSRAIYVYKSKSLTDRGIRRTVWTAPSDGDHAYEIWAPEIHFLDGKWYIYYAADDGNNDHHKMWVLESNTSDALGEYTDKGSLATTGWAIDGTVFEKSDGKLYFLWSGDPEQTIYIAPMSDPYTLSGSRIAISKPTYSWETIGAPINEGPEVIERDGKIFLTYSCGGSWTADYCLGMSVCSSDADVLDPASWVKNPEPVFSRSGNVYGPGHHSFVKSPDDTQDWIVYHSSIDTGGSWNRCISMKQFTWNEDGTPNFGTPTQWGASVALPAGELTNTVGTSLAEDFSGNNDRWQEMYYFRNDTIKIENGEYSVDAMQDGRYGDKALVRDYDYSNFALESDVKIIDGSVDGDILFRAREYGIGIDNYKGYIAGLNVNGYLELGKSNGSTFTSLLKYNMTVDKNKTYHMKIIANGSNIKVFVDDMENPKINVEDTDYTTGQLGVRAVNSHVHFDNFAVTPKTVTISTVKTDVTTNGGSNGSIIVTAAGITGTYEYSCDNGATWQDSNEFTGLKAGAYSVKARDKADPENVSDASSITIGQPGAKTVTISTVKTDVTTNGGSNGSIIIAAAGITGTYEYSCNNGQTWQDSNKFTGLKAGTYIVKARDKADPENVSAASSITIGQPGASSGHGGNPSSSSGSSSTTETTPTTPVSGITTSDTYVLGGQSSVTSTIATEAKSGKDGKATAAVTESQVTEAINKAVEEAAKKGEGTEKKVDIKVTAPTDAKAVEASLPKTAIDKLAEKKSDAMTISTPIAAITFDKESVGTISQEATSDVKITASKVDTATLSQEIKQAVGDRPVLNFSVTSGDRAISQFGGNVTVALPYTPKAGEDIHAIVIYYINAQGKPEIVSNCVYDAAKGTISFKTTHFSMYAVGYNKVNFKDVPSSAWYSTAVSFVAARGITSGSGNGNFSPVEKLTRGQFITMVMKAYGMKPDENPKDNFADAGNKYYTGYLAAAKRLGISEGVGNNMFVPDNEITRQEMFTLLYNALKLIGELPAGNSGKSLNGFSDTKDIASWAKPAMSLFVETGILSGDNSKLSPKVTTDRAQMAQVLYNLITK